LGDTVELPLGFLYADSVPPEEGEHSLTLGSLFGKLLRQRVLPLRQVCGLGVTRFEPLLGFLQRLPGIPDEAGTILPNQGFQPCRLEPLGSATLTWV
jgi:hypothetical protein